MSLIDRRMIEGPLSSRRDTLLVLHEGGAESIPLSRVQSLWIQGRATKRGALTGGIIGAAGGGLYLSFVAIIARAVGDGGTDEEEGAGYFARFALTGALLGAAGGGGIGALIGLSAPQWHPRYDSSRDLGDASLAGGDAPRAGDGGTRSAGDDRILVFSDLAPGTRARLRLADRRTIEGRLRGARGDTLLLDEDALVAAAAGARRTAVPLPLVDAFWVRGAATKKAALAGALWGGVAAGAAQAIGYLVSTGQSDGEEYDFGWHLGLTALAAGVGAGVGLAGGALVGSGLETWEARFTERPAEASAREDPTSPGPEAYGGISIEAGVASGARQCLSGTPLLTGCAFHARISKRFALGGEIGGTWSRMTRRVETQIVRQSEVFLSAKHLHYAGVNMRLLGRPRAVTPFASGSVGGYRSGDLVYVGGAAGLGARVSLPGLPGGLEVSARWHGYIQDVGEPCQPSFFSLTLGLRPWVW